MKITIACVGKLKEKYLTAAMDEYVKRLQPFCKLDIVSTFITSDNQRVNFWILTALPLNVFIFLFRNNGLQLEIFWRPGVEPIICRG